MNLEYHREITREEAESQVIVHRGEVYTFWDEGCTRYVYVNEDQTKVVKIARDFGSQFANIEEFEIYHDSDSKHEMAKTDFVDGVIEQEFVMPIKFGGIKLTKDQRIFAQSCRNEVGWTSNGELVCFDLSDYKQY